MKPLDPKVIDILNDVLTAELTAINQYFVHSEMCRNWGYAKLAAVLRERSMEEMRDAQELIRRVLYFEGVPNVQRYWKVQVGQTVKEQLTADLGVEKKAIEMLNKHIELCRSVADHGSRELLEKILVNEEAHTDWLEAQLTLMDQVVEANCLAQQMKPEGSADAAHRGSSPARGDGRDHHRRLARHRALGRAHLRARRRRHRHRRQDRRR